MTALLSWLRICGAHDLALAAYAARTGRRRVFDDVEGDDE